VCVLELLEEEKELLKSRRAQRQSELQIKRDQNNYSLEFILINNLQLIVCSSYNKLPHFWYVLVQLGK